MIRELNDQEIEQVSGGLLPVVSGIIAAAGHFGARTMIQSALGRIGLGLFVYETASRFSKD